MTTHPYRRRTVRSAIGALVAAALLGAATAVPATADPAGPAAAPSQATTETVPPPHEDPFYDLPPHLDRKRDGTVLRWRALPADALAVPAPARVWQLLYKTRDNAGHATATAGTLLVPVGRPAGGASTRPLVSYQTPEDGLSTSCAPSYLLRAGATGPAGTLAQARFDGEQVAAAVRRGWAVMVPDYEGPASEFLGAGAAAHGVLDGIRAARSFRNAHVGRRAPVTMWGYSGGGFATAAAAQLQRRYAPELRISGVAVGGVPADLNAVLRSVSGQPYSGWIPFGLAALRNTYPDADIDQYLNASARAYADDVAHDCAGEAVISGPAFADLDQFEARPGSLTRGAFHEFAHDVSPVGIGGTPTAPVYMYHGTADELLPISGARELAAQYRSRGADVVLTEHEGQNHGSEQEYGVAGAVAFLEQQLVLPGRTAD
ncbi:lipase family protein [Myceligenerans indicum]|uniref:Lipase n=1 Tax=Myceligenerans indicum TaxID=2593663 RepID=A0ABS1LII0_9MICO|nr:lipase family protein [Myceligenerans indicum]MBL0885928.1 lipase [Myceligenerans indicum]